MFVSLNAIEHAVHSGPAEVVDIDCNFGVYKSIDISTPNVQRGVTKISKRVCLIELLLLIEMS